MANRKPNKVRIIAGHLRGREITFIDGPGLRPTGDRLRETLFSWLQPYIVDSNVLDVFAGSGALGFESASRGAARVTMLEKSRKVCAELRQNLIKLKLDNVDIHCGDALQMISANSQSELASRVNREVNSDASGGIQGIGSFDIIFIDPPFQEHLHQRTVDAVARTQRLNKNTHVVIESDKRGQSVITPADWHLAREKIAGEVHLQLYRVGE